MDDTSQNSSKPYYNCGLVIRDLNFRCLRLYDNKDKPEGFTTLDWCEENCHRYYSCDTVALVDDILKELNGEIS